MEAIIESKDKTLEIESLQHRVMMLQAEIESMQEQNEGSRGDLSNSRRRMNSPINNKYETESRRNSST